MDSKKEMEDKIKEIERKLGKLSKELDGTDVIEDSHINNISSLNNNRLPKYEDRRKTFVIGSSPIGHDKKDTIKKIAEAKKNSIQKAGSVKNTQDGSVFINDIPKAKKIPEGSIHFFENLMECICDCHPTKKDCMKCYDHPVHLEAKRNIPKITEEDVVIEPIKKKHWWKW